MKHPPTADLDYRPLHDIAMGPLKAALMNYGIDTQVFDELTDFTTAEDVSRTLGTHPDNTRRLLDALATIDLVEKKAGRYRNLPIARRYLVTNSPTCIGPLLKQTQSAGLNPLDRLEHLVKKGPGDSRESTDFADESIWAEEVKASAGWVFGGTGQLVAGIIAALPGFSSFAKMLDMGCGHGVFSLYILNKHPTLSSVLMDRPAVLDAAGAFIDAYEANDRVVLLPGDYITGDIGSDYDLVFASSTLNFAIGQLDPLVSKIYHALKPGGYFVSFQDGMTHEQTKPDTMLGAVLPAMMMGFDYCFPQGMIAEAAVRCGFRTVRSKTVNTSIGQMDIDIARRPR